MCLSFHAEPLRLVPPMPTDEKTEQLLRSFVTEGRQERVKQGEDAAATQRLLFQMQNQLALMDQKNDNGFVMVNSAIRGLDARVTKLESNVEDTGRHNIEELKKELDRAKAREARKMANAGAIERANRTWWERHKITMGLSIVMIFIGGGIKTMYEIVLRHVP